MIQVPPFDPYRPLGGAEVVATHQAMALATRYDVTVVCGHPPSRPAAEQRLGSIRVLHGFPADEMVRERGHVQPRFNSAAREAIASAELVVTVERSLDEGPDRMCARRIVTLGGVGYPHTFDVLRHQTWDRLVVPSNVVARQVAARVPDARDIVAVPNGVDTRLFRPRHHRERDDVVRLLLAGRPVADKGMHAAARLVEALNADGIASRLVCTVQPDGLDCDAGLLRLASQSRRSIDALPWQDRAAMPALFASADLTLCLGTAEEGFGLTAAESVCCGTPVLATPVGLLATLVPADHGITLVDPVGSVRCWVAAARHATLFGRAQCMQRGWPYIRRHFPLSQMTAGFMRVVGSLL